jgi:hypothetical protein
VGEKTAMADINTDFKPTHVELPDAGLTERGRRELVRDLEAEQGFAHRVLPLGAQMTLQANGNLTPRDEQYKELLYKKGSSAQPGDRVVVTALEFKGDRIVIDLNGGPYPPHRFMRHIQIGIGNVETQQPTLDERATGCRIALVFEGGIPELSAPEVKALLQPVIDFGAKTSEVAYAETLPTPLKSAIASHEVLVGMNHRMVLAALGQPESKIREGSGNDRYEEWIYGHQPQTMRWAATCLLRPPLRWATFRPPKARKRRPALNCPERSRCPSMATCRTPACARCRCRNRRRLRSTTGRSTSRPPAPSRSRRSSWPLTDVN